MFRGNPTNEFVLTTGRISYVVTVGAGIRSPSLAFCAITRGMHRPAGHP